jgi:hypothetical protein
MCCSPELFQVNDFTAPGGATRKGDGKNPAPHRIIYRPFRQNAFASLTPSSFGPRFRTVNSKFRS